MASLTECVVFAPETSDKAWLPGLLHTIAACAAAPVLGIAPAVTGLLMATLVSFIVYLPLTVLALNGGEALSEDAEAPAVTPAARVALLVLWTATAWTVAATAASVG
jgi:hypothetical protein